MDWTIIRPGGLVNAPRADVADLILNNLEAQALVHKTVTITN